MAIEIPEQKLMPFFNTGQRDILRKLGDVIEEGVVAAIVADPTVLDFDLDDMNDVVAPSPVAGDTLTFDGVDWVSDSPVDVVVVNDNAGVAVYPSQIKRETWYIMQGTGGPSVNLAVTSPVGSYVSVPIVVINRTGDNSGVSITSSDFTTYAAGILGDPTVAANGSAVIRRVSDGFQISGDIS
jgi:hypothetical protein